MRISDWSSDVCPSDLPLSIRHARTRQSRIGGVWMSGTITATPPGVTPYPRPAVGWYATVVLALLYWFSVLDRFIIGLMLDPIKRDLDLTDLQFGIRHDSAFATPFSVVGLPAGKGTSS